ncbi:MAG: hypothetical protein K6B44_05130 [Lachnospiraceae bacterium]|nr:hypothetical protein [Lachnospiraceae bacterium]
MSKKSTKKATFKSETGFIVFLVISAIIAIVHFHGKGGDNIRSDGLTYYMYFQRIFLDKKLAGTGMISYPCGATLLETPFLLLTCLISKILGLETEHGLARQFHGAVSFAAFFYWALGISFIYRLLRKRYKQSVSLLSCIALTLGTMLPEYVLDMSSFSHAYGFFACAAFFCYIDRYDENRGGKYVILQDALLGLLLGLCFIVRNTNVAIGAAYLFYKVTDIKSFGLRLKKILGLRLIPQLIAFAIPVGMQFVLWRIMNGAWIIYSYGSQGFPYALKPQVLRVLFSDAKGLFIFCPILLVAVISMIAFRKDNPEYRVSQWVIFAAVTYFVSAWWCWWLGTAYGERMHCDILCVFALPLAAFFDNSARAWQESERKDNAAYVRGAVVAAYVICVVFIALNLIFYNGCLEWKISPNFATWYQMKNYIAEILGVK